MAVLSIKSAGWLHTAIEAVQTLKVWVADGVANTFSVTGLTKIVRLTRTDWQGTVALSASARTNYCSYSEDLTQWAVHKGTGSATATTLTDSDTTNTYTKKIQLTIPADSQKWFCSWIIGKSAPNIVGLRLSLFGGMSFSNALAFDTVTGQYAMASPSDGSLPSDIQVSDLGANGWRVSCSVTNNGTNTTLTMMCLPAYAVALGNPTVSDLTLTGSATFGKCQAEKNALTAYIGPTTTAPVTVTDYALASEEVTLGETPVAGAVFTLDGDITTDVEA